MLCSFAAHEPEGRCAKNIDIGHTKDYTFVDIKRYTKCQILKLQYLSKNQYLIR